MIENQWKNHYQNMYALLDYLLSDQHLGILNFIYRFTCIINISVIIFHFNPHFLTCIVIWSFITFKFPASKIAWKSSNKNCCAWADCFLYSEEIFVWRPFHSSSKNWAKTLTELAGLMIEGFKWKIITKMLIIHVNLYKKFKMPRCWSDSKYSNATSQLMIMSWSSREESTHALQCPSIISLVGSET